MFAEASWQVFILCIVIALFMMWVMTLKKQIIGLSEKNAKLAAENRKLKESRDRPPTALADAPGTFKPTVDIEISA